MKKVYFLWIVLIAPFFAFGQIINIPDANFKAKLLSASPANEVAATSTNTATYVSIDTNADGEIEVSEAAIIKLLNVGNANISSLEGVENFSALEGLTCYQNNLTSINLNGLSMLAGLECSYNQLTSLDLSNVTSPHFDLNCSYNQLQELIMPNISLIMDISCSHNLLTSIDLSRLSAIGEFNVSFNNLTSLLFNNPNNTGVGDYYLDVSDNPLTEVDFSALVPDNTLFVQMEGLKINNTALTEITLPNVYLAELMIQNNPNLQYLNLLNNGGETATDFKLANCLSCYIQITNNPELHVICGDEDETYNTLLSQLGNTNVNVTSYCSFTPTGLYNTVTGTVKLDTNTNGCDASDIAFAHLPIKIMQGNNVVGTVFTDNNGNYTGYNSGNPNCNYEPQFDNPYYVVNPAYYESTFTNYGNTETVDFCITPNGVHNDLQISILPMNTVRPGFDSSFRIVYKNRGTSTSSGMVDFTHTAHFEFVTANPTATVNGNTLSWIYTDLLPLEERVITLTLNTNSPMDTPPVLLGELYQFLANITPEIGDENYYDNHATLTQTVVGSFDPNDKAVSKLTAYVDAPEEYLQYTIRFQNTGTAAAENVVVKDLLHEKLDLASLQIVSTSHDCRTVLSDRKLEFIFEGINLPDSTTDEPASHGYVTFKIKALPTVQIGDIITNEANIYFDFNFPILTNPVSTVYQSVLATKPFEKDDVFTIYPNPTRETLQLVATTDSIKSIGIYNIIGQLVQSFEIKDFGKNFTLNVSQLQSGTYFVELVSGRGKTTQKFIKY